MLEVQISATLPTMNDAARLAKQLYENWGANNKSKLDSVQKTLFD